MSGGTTATAATAGTAAISASEVATAGLALSAIGTGAGIMGQMQQAQAAKASADYQAQVAAGNQKVASENATMAMQSGEEKAATQQQQTRAQYGAELAAEGSSGIDINSSTSRAVRTSTQQIGALDAQTTLSNAARQAYGYEVQASNFGNASTADTATGNNAMTAGEIGSSASLLSGVGKAGLNYASVINNANGALVGSIQNPASSNYSAEQSYDNIAASEGL